MRNRRTRGLITSTVALVLLSGCASDAETPPNSTTSTSATTTASAPTATTTDALMPTTPATRTVNWFDLDVGDCLADPPPVDPNVITVAVVECATPHRAEVYLRAPLAVNTAVADVADRKCGDGFAEYTGQRVGSGAYAVTYLIDSNQNRTSSNPDPSTVICLLQAPDGGPLTQTARR